MRPLIALGLALALLPAQPDACHARWRHVWSRMLPADGNVTSPPSALYSSPRIAVAGTNGDFFVVAQAANHVSFGAAPVGPGIVAARLNADGDVLWNRTLSSNFFTIAGMVVREGALILAGSYSGTIQVGGVTMSSSQNSRDVFLIALDAGGSVLWNRSFGDRLDQWAASIALAPDGDILLTGGNSGSIDFGGGLIRSSGNSDVFLARLKGSDGTHVWSRGYGQIGAQTGETVTVGNDGRIALVCQLTTGGIDLGGGLITPYGDGDIVVAVFDENANHVWSRIIGSPRNEHASDVTFDGSDNLYMCGYFERSLITGGDLLVAEPTAWRTGFLVSYGPAGEFKWSYAMLDSLDSNGAQLGIDDRGECVLLATKAHSLELAGSVLPAASFLLVNFDPSGAATSASAFGAPGAYTTMSALSNRIYLAGFTDEDIALGDDELSPQGRQGMFIGRLDTVRLPKITISDFTAHADGGRVDLHWTVSSGEALSRYYLTRRIDGSAQEQVINSAPAEDGAATFVDDAVRPGHFHTYQLTVETSLGDPVSKSVSVDVPTLQTALAQNSPNPFNPLTTFAYTLAAPARVSIVIYDLSGALVCKLDQGMQPAGIHRAQWAGHNWEGNLVASGVYFYRLEGAGDVPARKMLLLK